MTDAYVTTKLKCIAHLPAYAFHSNLCIQIMFSFLGLEPSRYNNYLLHVEHTSEKYWSLDLMRRIFSRRYRCKEIRNEQDKIKEWNKWYRNNKSNV